MRSLKTLCAAALFAATLAAADQRLVEAPYVGTSLSLGEVRIPMRMLVAFGVAVALTVALTLYLSRTFTGRAIKAVAQDEVGDLFQFCAAPYASGRVVGIAEHEDARRRGDGRFKVVEVDFVLMVGAANEWVVLTGHAGGGDCVEEGAVERRLHDDRFTGRGECPGSRVEARHTRQKDRVVVLQPDAGVPSARLSATAGTL